jgi:alkylation response protein AidB-like acyl-CoA dehydrogenase
MDMRDGPGEAEFRKEVRAWLAEHAGEAPPVDADQGSADVPAWRAWSRRLYDAGLVGITWPKEYGGRGLPPSYHAVWLEENARAGVPDHIGVIGLGMAGPTIIAHGTAGQKDRLLAPLLRADEIWCQGFSEPGSGSDLAGARTSAVLDGEFWVVNGQKVWSSWAHIADWCILVVRSDPDAAKHRGLSYLLVDMHTPGIEVRPLRQITGDPEFNEIFFTDVRVPRENILGRPGDGWAVAMTTLLHERGTLGVALTARLETELNKAAELLRRPGPDGRRPADDPAVADGFAELWVELQALRVTNLRAMSTLLRTGVPGPEGSISKLHWSEVNQRLTHLVRQVLGPDGLLGQPDGPAGGRWSYWQLRSRGNTIEAGTSEVLRNIIAERVVGLPRSR